MSLKTYVKHEEKSILSYLKIEMGIFGQEPENFIDWTSQKIETYVQEVYKDIQWTIKHKTSLNPHCFSIKKQVSCHREILEIINTIFSNYQISMKIELADTPKKAAFFNLMSPVKLKNSIRYYNVFFNWSPKNPYLYEPQGIDMSYKSDLPSIMLNEWKKAQEGKDTDFTIIVGDTKFPVHKFVLSRSEYFQTLFKPEMTELSESKKDEMKIEGFDPEIVKHFLKFIYTREITDPKVKNSAQILIEIIKMGHQYREKNLINACCSELNTLLRNCEIDLDGLKQLLSITLELEEPQLHKIFFNHLLFDITALDSLPLLVTQDNFQLLFEVVKDEPLFASIKKELEMIRKYNPSLTNNKELEE